MKIPNMPTKLQKENIPFTSENKPFVIIMHREVSTADGSLVERAGNQIFSCKMASIPQRGQAYDRVNSNTETIIKGHMC